MEAQGDVCEICQRPPRPHKDGTPGRLDRDHDRSTPANLPRGWACNRCDRLIGSSSGTGSCS
jgi:hypothetical protein